MGSLLLITTTVIASSQDRVRLQVNGETVQPDVAPQIINGRAMVPARWIAQALGASVHWDDATRTVSFSNQPVSREQVVALLEDQGGDAGSYYLEGLSFALADLDGDGDMEVLAKIDGGVHLGQWFIFDQQADGTYQLITEQDLKVESWGLDQPAAWQDHRMFAMTTRTGGTGTSSTYAHLWYLHKGEYTEVWRGLIKETTHQPGGEVRKVIGGYTVDQGTLHHWTTETLLAEDGSTPVAPPKTILNVYEFTGGAFKPRDM